MNFFSDPQMGVFFDPIWDKGEICAEICDGSGSSDTFSVNFLMTHRLVFFSTQFGTREKFVQKSATVRGLATRFL